jgi:hypothetical protein
MYIAGNGEVYDDDEIMTESIENDDLYEDNYQVCKIDYSIDQWEGTLKLGF